MDGPRCCEIRHRRNGPFIDRRPARENAAPDCAGDSPHRKPHAAPRFTAAGSDSPSRKAAHPGATQAIVNATLNATSAARFRASPQLPLYILGPNDVVGVSVIDDSHRLRARMH